MFKVLDLFCGAGGAAMGLHRAWPDAEIIGVDIAPMPRYPFRFVQADAMTFPLVGYDFIWASPPCQFYSVSITNRYAERRSLHPDFLPETRDRLKGSDIPWAIENVIGAPMRGDFVLCGSMFGMPIVRHRVIEVSFPVCSLLPPCNHPDISVTLYGDGTPSWMRRKRRAKGMPPDQTKLEMQNAINVGWMTRNEMCQCVPPAYSEFIARQFRA